MTRLSAIPNKSLYVSILLCLLTVLVTYLVIKETRLKNLHSYILDIKKDINEIKEEYNKLINNLKDDISRNRETIDKLDGDYHKINEKNKGLEKEIESKTIKITEIEGMPAIKKLQQEIKIIATKNQRLRNKDRARKREIDANKQEQPPEDNDAGYSDIRTRRFGLFPEHYGIFQAPRQVTAGEPFPIHLEPGKGTFKFVGFRRQGKGFNQYFPLDYRANNWNLKSNDAILQPISLPDVDSFEWIVESVNGIDLAQDKSKYIDFNVNTQDTGLFVMEIQWQREDRAIEREVFKIKVIEPGSDTQEKP